MHRLKKPLQIFEAFLALDSEQVVLMSPPRSTPPVSDHSGVVADIFLSEKRIEGAVVKGQVGVGVRNAEANPLSFARCRRYL